MLVTPTTFEDPRQLGEAAAAVVVDRVRAAGGRPFLLGCPSGRSPLSTYRALARRVADADLDLSGLVVVMMDEYLVPGPDGSLVREDPAALHSCARFGREEVLEPLRRAASAVDPRRAPAADALWLPDPADPGDYDRRILDAGGVDLFLLASGASDGHVAFNPPGSDAGSSTRVVELPLSTRTDNLATFASFEGDVDRVPRHGITVGTGTIRGLSREVLMLCHGASKGRAVAHLTRATGYDPAWPATVLSDCASPAMFVDRAAAEAAALQPA